MSQIRAAGTGRRNGKQDRVRRRDRSVWTSHGQQLVVWAIVLAGPATGLYALSAVRAVPPPPEAVLLPPAEVTDTATRFVYTWLTASEPADVAAFVRVDQVAFVPREPITVAVAAAEAVRLGWEVTVSATFPGAVTEWYRVELLRHDDDRTLWSVSGFPARVDDPLRSEPVSIDTIGQVDEDDPRIEAVQGWLEAVLTGVGDPNRFTASAVRSPSPPSDPFDSVEILSATATGPANAPQLVVTVAASQTADEVTSGSGTAGDLGSAVDASDSTTSAVAVGVDDGAVLMTYSFELAVSDGRWEIAVLFPRSFTSSYTTN